MILCQVVNGIRPQSIEKVENPEIRDVIDRCTKLNKDERPSMKQLLVHEFFLEDTGFKLEILDREIAVQSDSKVINFCLR